MNKKIETIDHLINEINDLSLFNNHKLFLILIGGCSRSGKSVLANKLKDRLKKENPNTNLLNLDSWIISAEKRKPDSNVLERYDSKALIDDVNRLLDGESVQIPNYDPISRKRLQSGNIKTLLVHSGVLIIEGVVALALKDLMVQSDLRIFVDVPDYLRIKRLIKYYGETKKLPKNIYKKIILDREKEEVPFIKKTSSEADIIFQL